VKIGVAKEKKAARRKQARETPVYKPLLAIDVPTFLASLKILRENRYIIGQIGSEQKPRKLNDAAVQATSRSISGNFSKQFKVIIEEVFPELWRIREKELGMNVNTHVFRSVYAKMSYHFHRMTLYSEPAWFQKVLGHDNDNMTTSQNYGGIEILEAAPMVDKTLKAELTSITTDISKSDKNYERLSVQLKCLQDAVNNIKDEGVFLTVKEIKTNNKTGSRCNTSELDTVVLKDNDGNNQILTPIPKVRYSRSRFSDTDIRNGRIRRVQDAMNRLNDQGIPQIKRNVRAMGISNESIQLWKSAQKY